MQYQTPVQVSVSEEKGIAGWKWKKKYLLERLKELLC